MAIADILWACPACGKFGSIRPADHGTERCSCGAEFSRGPNSVISAAFPDGRKETRHAAEWMDSLPLERPRGAAGELARARASVRSVAGYQVLRRGSDLLNRIEQMGPPSDVTMVLYDDRLEIVPEAGDPAIHPLETIVALGSSSGNLQLRFRETGLLSVRFQDASIRWWEEQLRVCLRRLYARADGAEIVEFQPRIVAL